MITVDLREMGKAIREMREDAGMSKHDLAVQVSKLENVYKIDDHVIGHYESGHIQPMPKRLANICKVLRGKRYFAAFVNVMSRSLKEVK